MALFLEKKPSLIRNAIVEQVKQAANSLTIQQWNDVVNTLKLQTNITVEYLEKLHKVLFGNYASNTVGLYEFEDDGAIFTLLSVIESAQEIGTLKTNFYGKANETITAGDFIMYGGTSGDHILFVKANLNAVGFESEYILGVAESNMAIGDFGNVRWFGQVSNLSLNVQAGTFLYVGQNAGTFTTTEPANGKRILMAIVEKQSTNNENNGIMLVRPTFGGSDTLSITNPTDGQFLRYNGTTSHFENISANKVVASLDAPDNNKNNDIWFDI